MHVVQIGCGTIGFAYACALASKGLQVTMLDKSERVVQQHMDSCDIFHVDDVGVELLRDVAAIFLAVPTPLLDDRLDFQYLADTLTTVERIVRANPATVVVLRRCNSRRHLCMHAQLLVFHKLPDPSMHA